MEGSKAVSNAIEHAKLAVHRKYITGFGKRYSDLEKSSSGKRAIQEMQGEVERSLVAYDGVSTENASALRAHIALAVRQAWEKERHLELQAGRRALSLETHEETNMYVRNRLRSTHTNPVSGATHTLSMRFYFD